MDQMPTPDRTRRRRRRGPVARLRAGAALGSRHGRLRAGLFLAALVVAGTALSVGLGSGGGGAVAAGTEAPATASPTPRGATPAIPASAAASLPPLATPAPAGSASTAPTGVVARRVRVDRLGIDLRIVEGDGIDAPMHRAAHFPGSGWPRGGSNVYLYAHAQEGMFLPLWEARVGDEVVLELVDGTEARYVVTRVRPRVPWDEMEVTRPTPTERLSLQTSTSYTPTAPRFLVIAEPVP